MSSIQHTFSSGSGSSTGSSLPLDSSPESVNRITDAVASATLDVNRQDTQGGAPSKKLQERKFDLPKGPDVNLLCEGFSDEKIQAEFKNYLTLCAEVVAATKSLKRHDEKLKGRVEKLTQELFEEIAQQSVFGIHLLTHLLRTAQQLTDKKEVFWHEQIRDWDGIIRR